MGPARHGFLCFVLSGLETRAIWIRPAGSRQCRLDCFTGGSHHEHIQTRDRNLIAWPCDGVPGLGVELWIRPLQELISSGGGLNVPAVVDEIPDWDTRGEFGHAAK